MYAARRHLAQYNEKSAVARNCILNSFPLRSQMWQCRDSLEWNGSASDVPVCAEISLTALCAVPLPGVCQTLDDFRQDTLDSPTQPPALSGSYCGDSVASGAQCDSSIEDTLPSSRGSSSPKKQYNTSRLLFIKDEMSDQEQVRSAIQRIPAEVYLNAPQESEIVRAGGAARCGAPPFAAPAARHVGHVPCGEAAGVCPPMAAPQGVASRRERNLSRNEQERGRRTAYCMGMPPSTSETRFVELGSGVNRSRRVQQYRLCGQGQDYKAIYGFLEFTTKEEADDFVAKTHNQMEGGLILRCSIANQPTYNGRPTRRSGRGGRVRRQR
eukprot:TRINITY_DN36825_c0_g1_i1.p1 TRINITY_DN36825_c0_g1~~TRINITY_DN36825_c0_g1_i1.p1  ORF type:complete len:326 (+),score=30.18 TRINITY_DN36825_c0_g1_i1:130-1107(+)